MENRLQRTKVRKTNEEVNVNQPGDDSGLILEMAPEIQMQGSL